MPEFEPEVVHVYATAAKAIAERRAAAADTIIAAVAPLSVVDGLLLGASRRNRRKQLGSQLADLIDEFGADWIAIEKPINTSHSSYGTLTSAWCFTQTLTWSTGTLTFAAGPTLAACELNAQAAAETLADVTPGGIVVAWRRGRSA